MADRMAWPTFLSRDRKWPRVITCTHSREVGLRLENNLVFLKTFESGYNSCTYWVHPVHICTRDGNRTQQVGSGSVRFPSLICTELIAAKPNQETVTHREHNTELQWKRTARCKERSSARWYLPMTCYMSLVLLSRSRSFDPEENCDTRHSQLVLVICP